MRDLGFVSGFCFAAFVSFSWKYLLKCWKVFGSIRILEEDFKAQIVFKGLKLWKLVKFRS
jgi:hypothetical protein